MELLISFLLLHLFFVLISIVFIFKSKNIELSQKYLQCLFSIILVFIGPIITIFIHVNDLIKKGTPSDRYIGQSLMILHTAGIGLFKEDFFPSIDDLSASSCISELK